MSVYNTTPISEWSPQSLADELDLSKRRLKIATSKAQRSQIKDLIVALEEETRRRLSTD